MIIKNTIREFENNNPRGHVSPHTLWETLKVCFERGNNQILFPATNGNKNRIYLNQNLTY